MKDLIDAYLQGPQQLRDAVRGLSTWQLYFIPPADAGVGQWSIRQIILHLADDELVYSNHMRRVIAEDNPTLLNFDETVWAEKLAYDERSVPDALELINLIRRDTALILRRLPESAWERIGTHTVAGPRSLQTLVRLMVQHVPHHIVFIEKKRQLMLSMHRQGTPAQ